MPYNNEGNSKHRTSTHTGASQSEPSVIVKVADLINMAMGPTEKNTVNFKMIQTILHILARNMRLLDQAVELRSSDITQLSTTDTFKPSRPESKYREKTAETAKEKEKADRDKSKDREEPERDRNKKTTQDAASPLSSFSMDKIERDKYDKNIKDELAKIAKIREVYLREKDKERAKVAKMNDEERDIYLKDKDGRKRERERERQDKEKAMLTKLNDNERKKYLMFKEEMEKSILNAEDKYRAENESERSETDTETYEIERVEKDSQSSPEEKLAKIALIREIYLREKERELDKLGKLDDEEREQYFKDKGKRSSVKERERHKKKEMEKTAEVNDLERNKYIKENEERDNAELTKQERYEKHISKLPNFIESEQEKYLNQKEKEEREMTKDRRRADRDKERERHETEQDNIEEREKYLRDQEQRDRRKLDAMDSDKKEGDESSESEIYLKQKEKEESENSKLDLKSIERAEREKERHQSEKEMAKLAKMNDEEKEKYLRNNEQRNQSKLDALDIEISDREKDEKEKATIASMMDETESEQYLKQNEKAKFYENDREREDRDKKIERERHQKETKNFANTGGEKREKEIEGKVGREKPDFNIQEIQRAGSEIDEKEKEKIAKLNESEREQYLEQKDKEKSEKSKIDELEKKRAVRGKEREEQREKEQEEESETEREYEHDKRDQEHEKEREKEQPTEQERDVEQEMYGKRKREIEREEERKEHETERQLKDKKERDKEYEKERKIDRQKEKEKERDQKREKEVEKKREIDREKEPDKKRERELEKQREKELGKERKKEREKEREKDREKEREKEREKDLDKELEKEREKERVKKRGKKREAEGDGEREKERDGERKIEREQEVEREQDNNIKREREREKEREIKREREIKGEREMERDREKERERDKEKGRETNFTEKEWGKGKDSRTRAGSIEVVTRSEFELLEAKVNELEEKTAPIPYPSMPDNEKLRTDLASGRASLTDTMEAMQVSARVQATETAISQMADLLTQLAAAGALPQDVVKQVGEVTAGIGRPASGEDPGIEGTTSTRTSLSRDELSKPRRSISTSPTPDLEGTLPRDGGAKSSRSVGSVIDERIRSVGISAPIDERIRTVGITEDGQSRTVGDGRKKYTGGLTTASRAHFIKSCVTHPDLDDAQRELEDTLIRKINDMVLKALRLAEIADMAARKVSDQMEIATRVSVRIEDLFSLVNDYGDQLSGFDAGVSSQLQYFNEQIFQIRCDLNDGIVLFNQSISNKETEAVRELNKRYEDLVIDLDETRNTLHKLDYFQNVMGDEVTSIQKSIEALRAQKADRDELLDGIRDKADKRCLEGLLGDEDFEPARLKLEEKLEGFYNKFNKQEEVWIQALDDLTKFAVSKASGNELFTFVYQEEINLNKLKDDMQTLATAVGEPKAILLARKISEGGTCGPCQAPAHQDPTADCQPPLLPVAMRRHPPIAEEACAQPVKEPRQLGEREHFCKRWIGGSHTLINKSVVHQDSGDIHVYMPPTKKYAGIGNDGKLYQLEDLLLPCGDCNKPDIDEEKKVQEEGAGEPGVNKVDINFKQT